MTRPAKHRAIDSKTCLPLEQLWYAKRGHPTGPHPLGHKHSAYATEDPRPVLRSLVARTNSAQPQQPSPSYEHARVQPAARFTTRTHEIHTAPRTNPHHCLLPPLPFLRCLPHRLPLPEPDSASRKKKDNSSSGGRASNAKHSSKGNNKSRRHQIEKVFISMEAIQSLTNSGRAADGGVASVASPVAPPPRAPASLLLSAFAPRRVHRSCSSRSCFRNCYYCCRCCRGWSSRRGSSRTSGGQPRLGLGVSSPARVFIAEIAVACG